MLTILFVALFNLLFLCLLSSPVPAAEENPGPRDRTEVSTKGEPAQERSPEEKDAPPDSVTSSSTEKPLLVLPVTVTATRYEEEAINVPYTITSLSDEELRDKNETRLSRALKDTVGVGVAETGNVSDISILHLRGVNTGRGPLLNDTVGTLLDGLSISKPIPGFSTSFEPGKYPMFNIQRVEVLRGPAAVLYGKDAFAGALNLITKKPRSGPPFSDARAFYNQWPSFGGSYHFNSGDATFGHAAQFNGGYGNHQINTFRDHSKGTNEQAYGAVTVDVTARTRLTVGGSYSHYRQERPSTLTPQQLEEDRTQAGTRNPGFLETSLTLGRVDVEHELGPGLLITNAFQFNNSNDFLDLNDLTVLPDKRRIGDDPSRRIINDTRLTWSTRFFGRANRFQGGVMVDHFDVDFLFKIRDIETGVEDVLERGNGQHLIVSPYFLNRLDLTERLILWTGLRWDRITLDRNQEIDPSGDPFSLSTTFDAFSPHAGIVYHVNDRLRTYVNWSRSFRPISLRALTPREIAADVLKENLTNYELGFGFDGLEHRLNLRAAFFWMVWDDRTNEVFRGFDPAALNTEGRSTHRGVEVDLQYELLPGLTASLGATYLDAFNNTLRLVRTVEGDPTEIVLDGKRIQSVPTWTVLPGLTYETELGVHGGLRGRFIGSRWGDQFNTIPLDSYFLLDLSLGYRDPRERFGILATIQNLADNEFTALGVRFSPDRVRGFDPGAPRTFALNVWARF